MSDSETNANCNREGGIAQTRIQNVEDLEDGIVEAGSEAPTGLLAEFLSSIMTKDYETAFKFCAKILSYEPDNATARDFYPLILEKLELISNEEYDGSSSDTFSSGSRSSESCLSQVESQSSDDEKRFSSGDENYSNLGRKDAVKDLKTLKSNSEEAQTRKKNVETTKFRSFSPAKERSDKRSPVKTKSREKIQTKITDSNEQLPSKLLIHPTKTKILKSSSVSTGREIEERHNRIKSKKLKQKDQETPTFSGKPSSSKILLYPTRTVTFPKIVSFPSKCDKS